MRLPSALACASLAVALAAFPALAAAAEIPTSPPLHGLARSGAFAAARLSMSLGRAADREVRGGISFGPTLVREDARGPVRLLGDGLAIGGRNGAFAMSLLGLPVAGASGRSRVLPDYKEAFMIDTKPRGDGVSDVGSNESQGGRWPGEQDKPADNDQTTHNVTENKPVRDRQD